MNLETVPIRKTDLWRNEDGEVYILDGTGEEIHQLNETGTLIWELCNGSETVAEIVDSILERYEVDTETATKTTVEFLETMIEKGLIEFKE